MSCSSCGVHLGEIDAEGGKDDGVSVLPENVRFENVRFERTATVTPSRIEKIFENWRKASLDSQNMNLKDFILRELYGEDKKS